MRINYPNLTLKKFDAYLNSYWRNIVLKFWNFKLVFLKSWNSDIPGLCTEGFNYNIVICLQWRETYRTLFLNLSYFYKEERTTKCSKSFCWWLQFNVSHVNGAHWHYNMLQWSIHWWQHYWHQKTCIMMQVLTTH